MWRSRVMAQKACATCGATLEQGAPQCPNCGEPVAGGEGRPITVRVSLDYLSGEKAFDQEIVTIGRPDPDRGSRPDIDLSGDEAVSRFHAELRRREDGYYLVDLGSTNGTRIGEEEIAALSEVKLKSGDEISLGEKTRLVVQF